MAQATKLFDLTAQKSSALAARTASAAPAVVFTPAEQREETIVPEGPRKLVRPRLPEHLAKPAIAPRRLRGSTPLARHDGAAPQLRAATTAASHAESLYFQKQMQTQTPMVFVLEDGEQIEGVIEWFDRDTIKVRNSTRMLLFKRTIKYLYKAGGDLQS